MTRRLVLFIGHAPQPWCMTKANSSPAPLAKLRSYIFRNENNRRGPADEFVLVRIGIGRNQRKHRRPVGRCHRYPPLAGRKPGVESDLEPKLVQVETQASILISNENVNRVDPEVRFLFLGVQTGLVHLAR